MSLFESLEVVAAVEPESRTAMYNLPIMEGALGDQVEEVRKKLVKKLEAEMMLWDRIVGIYHPQG